MLYNFKTDLEAAKAAEVLVGEVLSSMTNEYTFEDVSDIREYYYKGDIKATSLSTGEEFFIEVKNDSRIADTHNVLCEHEVYIKETGRYEKGNMFCDYNIYCVVSEKEHKIYVIDFKTLKEKYKRGEFIQIDHLDQQTLGYLVHIGIINRWGALLAEIDYSSIGQL